MSGKYLSDCIFCAQQCLLAITIVVKEGNQVLRTIHLDERRLVHKCGKNGDNNKLKLNRHIIRESQAIRPRRTMNKIEGEVWMYRQML